MKAQDIVGNTRLSQEELQATEAYFLKKIRMSSIPASLSAVFADVVRARENELFGAPKFEAGQYGQNLPTMNDSNEMGEP